ncbi:MAG: hypothetical protein CMH49_04800, partial [Myxococcales bacterium]|nr:hypothetical protein [Myxococcales bacterium]
MFKRLMKHSLYIVVTTLFTFAYSSPLVQAQDTKSAVNSLEAKQGEVEALLDATDDLNRGRSSHSLMKMKVKTARYEREMKVEAWTQGSEKSLLKILSPKRDAGVSTLKVGDEAWNYLPKVDRT